MDQLKSGRGSHFVQEGYPLISRGAGLNNYRFSQRMVARNQVFISSVKSFYKGNRWNSCKFSIFTTVAFPASEDQVPDQIDLWNLLVEHPRNEVIDVCQKVVSPIYAYIPVAIKA